MERVPFLEEQVRKIRGTGKLLTGDIERLLLSEDNRFDFVNEVAAEAKMYVENNRDELAKSESVTATESDIYSVLLDELLKLNHSVEAKNVIRFMVERRIRIKSRLACFLKTFFSFVIFQPSPLFFK